MFHPTRKKKQRLAVDHSLFTRAPPPHKKPNWIRAIDQKTIYIDVSATRRNLASRKLLHVTRRRVLKTPQRFNWEIPLFLSPLVWSPLSDLTSFWTQGSYWLEFNAFRIFFFYLEIYSLEHRVSRGSSSSLFESDVYVFKKSELSLSFPRQVYNFLKLRYALYNLTNRLWI